MSPSQDRLRLPRWVWFALAAVLAGVPLAVSIGVPTPRVVKAPAVPATGAPSTTASGPAVTPAPTPTQGEDAATALDPAPAPVTAEATLPPPRSAHDVEYDALQAEMATLKVEKESIEAEAARLRGKRDELDQFEQDHPNGVPPELYARYEDERTTYNSDVRALKSRASAYQMKVAEIERRIENFVPAAP